LGPLKVMCSTFGKPGGMLAVTDAQLPPAKGPAVPAHVRDHDPGRIGMGEPFEV